MTEEFMKDGKIFFDQNEFLEYLKNRTPDGICDLCKTFTGWKGQKVLRDEVTNVVSKWNLCATCFDNTKGIDE